MDDARFESVWNAHGSAVVRYCTYSTGSCEAGEDVAAETFARFLAKGERVPVDREEPWLIRVARNLCASYHRDAKRRRLLEARLAENPETESDTWQRPDSWEYVRQLKENERLVIYLRVAEDRSFAEIAGLLGKSESAAKMTFYRAIDRLRQRMERDGVAEKASLRGGADYV